MKISNNLLKYYLKDVVSKLNKSYSNQQVADVIGVSLSVVKSIKSSDDTIISNKIIDIIGNTDEEYLRESAVYNCLSLFSSRGWQVGTTDSKCIYDVFAIKNDKLLKIQVRSGSKISINGFPRFKTGRILFNTKRVERTHFNKGDFDLWYFHHKNGDSWLIPFEDLKSVSEVSMEKYYNYFVE